MAIIGDSTNKQYFPLTKDTVGPTGCSIIPSSNFTNGSASYTFAATDCQYMDVYLYTAWDMPVDSEGTEWTQVHHSGLTPFSTSYTFSKSTIISTRQASQSDLSTFCKVKVYFYDQAGNSTIVENFDVIYDDTAPTVDTEGEPIDPPDVILAKYDGVDVDMTQGSSTYPMSTGITGSTSCFIGSFGGPDDSSNGMHLVYSDIDYVEASGDCTYTKVSYDDILESVETDRGLYYGIPVTLSASDGEKTITYKVTDKAGNSSQYSISIVLDQSADEYVLTVPRYCTSTPVQVTITGQDGALVYQYKVWDACHGQEPADWTVVTPASASVSHNVALTGEGTHTISAMVKDRVGNVTVCDNVTTTYDKTIPSATISTVSKSAISNITTPDSGWPAGTTVTSTTMTVSLSDTNSGIVRWLAAFETSASASPTKASSIPASSVIIIDKTENITTATKTFDITGAITASKSPAGSPANGVRYVAVYAQDAAGNIVRSATKSFIYDTTGPVISISASGYRNASQKTDFSFSATDASTSPNKMYLWVSTSSTDTTPPAGALQDYSSTPVSGSTYFDWTKIQDSRTCYAHAKVCDSVGNTSIAHSGSFIYDSVIPTASVTTAVTYTNNRNVAVTVSGSDATSYPKSYKLYGDIGETGATTEAQASWVNFSDTVAASRQASPTVKLSPNSSGVTSEAKVIKCKIMDNAGNVSAEAVCSTITYDIDAPEPDISLKVRGTDTTLPEPVNVLVATLKIALTTTSIGAPVNEYRFQLGYVPEDSQTETTQSWTSWKTKTSWTSPASEDITWTVPDVNAKYTIKVHVQVKDTAGNISDEVIDTRTYDPVLPIITISDLDFNVISTVTSQRQNVTSSVTPVAGAYYNKVNFKFSCNEHLQHWKVCVNAVGQTAAGAVAIPTAGGSTNMSGGALAANTAKSCVLTCTDFISAGATVDKAYEIIVYGQDDAGNWSEGHIMV